MCYFIEYLRKKGLIRCPQVTNWAHKHHFIVGKTKKTYSTDCENSHEKEQTGIFCDLKTCFYLPLSG